MTHRDLEDPSGRHFVVAVVLVALLGAIIGGVLWFVGGSDRSEPDPPAAAESREKGDRQRQRGAEGDEGKASPGLDAELGERAEDLARTGDRRVVVVSVDGLGSWAVTPTGAPTLTRLLAEGAGTLNARTAYEQTVTLPNHTSMVTGEPITGGHGVTWNVENPARQVAPGVSSVFSVIDDAGGTSNVYAGKTKFEIWQRAWPGTIDQFAVDRGIGRTTDRALRSMAAGADLTFVHFAAPDQAGHSDGWGSPAYDAAVAASDAEIARLAEAIASDPRLAQQVVLIVTADHGGVPDTQGHAVATDPRDFIIPFVVWGAGIAQGDLYDLNPDYADPGIGRPTYDGPQPVRNGDVANLVTDLLDLPAVPGSDLDARHDLTVD